MMSSIKIELHRSPVDNGIREQVVELVSANATALAMTHPPIGHPKFEAYKIALMIEVWSYLGMEAPYRMELITASSDGVLIGFTLCGLPINGSTTESGIYYTVVSKPFRGQGVLTLMMNNILARYPSVALSCDVALVPIYERYGFHCHSLRHNQIRMFLGEPVEETPVLSVDDLMENPGVVLARKEAAEKFSVHEMDRADRALAKRIRTDELNAKRFLQQRLKSRKPTPNVVPPAHA